jgi:flagellar biosynthetic protein FliQ
MSPSDVLDLARETVLVIVQVAGPVMLIALTVGLVIALIQALTQIQEMTLTFVPKILAMFLSLLIFLPFMGSVLASFMERIAARIATLGGIG